MTSEEIYKGLSLLREQALDSLIGLLNKKMNTESINVYYYYKEGDVDKYMFLDTDNDGYGKGLFIDTIKRVGDGEYVFNMVDEDEEDWGERDLTDFNVTELANILEMFEGLFDAVEDYYDGKLLEIGEYDYE